MVLEYEVGVTTHELLSRGVLVDQWVRVRVEAPNAWAGALTACQMAYCVGDGAYVTECNSVYRVKEPA